MADYKIPTPTNKPVPSADIRDVVFAGAKVDEWATSTYGTYVDRFGKQHLTAEGINNQFQQFLLNSGYEPLADYVDGPITFTRRNQITAYNGEFYRPKASVTLPYTTTGNTATTWATDESNFVAVGDATLRKGLSAPDGLYLVGSCSNLYELRSVTPQADGQRIKLDFRVNDYAGMSFGLPWGGGEFIYCSTLTGSQYADNGGSLIKPNSGGGTWVRSSLIDDRSNVMKVVWFMDGPPSFLVDASDAIKAALDAAALWAVSDDLVVDSDNAGPNGGLIECLMPPRCKVTKSIYCDISRVRINGGRGIVAFSPSGDYDEYTNTNIPPEINGSTAKVYGCIFLKSTAYGSRDEWPVYRDMVLVKDWTVALQDMPKDYYTMSGTTEDNGISAFVHYGDSSDNKTAYTAQAEMLNVNTHYFGLAYINGDYAWGVNFINCKRVSCYYQEVIIPGSDNSERYSWTDPVWQNGVVGPYLYKWQASVNIKAGSMDWMSGVNFKLYDFNGLINIQLNHWEIPHPTAKMIEAKWSAIPYGNNYTNVTQINIEANTLIIAPNAASTDVKGYIDVQSGFAVVNLKTNSVFYSGIDLCPNFTFLNPDTKHSLVWDNNILRGGIASQFFRDWRLKATWTNPYVLGSTYCTAGGATGAPAAMDAVWNTDGTLTLTANSTITVGYYMQIRVPVVRNNRNWNYIYPYLNLVKSSLTKPSDWVINWSFNTQNTQYSRASSAIGSLGLTNYNNVSATKEIFPTTSAGRPYVRNKYENLQNYQNIPSPDEIYVQIVTAAGFTAGDTLTIGDCGVYLA